MEKYFVKSVGTLYREAVEVQSGPGGGGGGGPSQTGPDLRECLWSCLGKGLNSGKYRKNKKQR